MKLTRLIGLLFCTLLLSSSVFSMDQPQRTEKIIFTDKSGDTYSLTPIDQFGEERFASEVSTLFQQKCVYEYYERGTPKSVADCKGIYQRVCCGRCDAVKDGTQLGWEIILDNHEQLAGFIGAAITAENKIEFCIAVRPDLQQKKVATHGLISYFSEHWPRLKPDIRSTITHVKAPVNPRNKASKQLAESLFEGCVDNTVYVPSYYQSLAKEKGERVAIEIPIAEVLTKLEDMKQQL